MQRALARPAADELGRQQLADAVLVQLPARGQQGLGRDAEFGRRGLGGLFTGKKTIHFEDIAGKGAKQLTFDQIPLDKMSVSMTMNGAVLPIMALYVIAAGSPKTKDIPRSNWTKLQ